MKPAKPIHVKPSLYAYYFYDLKKIALKYGYNLVLHGSLNRDMDLVAIPWQTIVKPHLKMIKEFAKVLGGHIMVQGNKEDPKKLFGILPQGRISYIININRGRDFENNDLQYYLDISVTPSK